MTQQFHPWAYILKKKKPRKHCFSCIFKGYFQRACNSMLMTFYLNILNVSQLSLLAGMVSEGEIVCNPYFCSSVGKAFPPTPSGFSQHFLLSLILCSLKGICLCRVFWEHLVFSELPGLWFGA